MTQDKAYERLESARQRIADQSEVTGHMITAVKEGKALADDGNTYDSVQDAVDAASSFVKIGPGTFNENVTISTSELTLLGSGSDTHIDGQSTTAITISSEDITVKSLSVSNNSDGDFSTGDDAIFVQNSANGTTVKNIVVIDSDSAGVGAGTPANMEIIGCLFEAGDEYAVNIDGVNAIVVNNMINGTRGGLNTNGDDNVLANNSIINPGADGFNTNGNDSIIISNRVHNSGAIGISYNASDSIIANNRVSDSTNSDIEDNGTNTTLDANLTGSAN